MMLAEKGKYKEEKTKNRLVSALKIDKKVFDRVTTGMCNMLPIEHAQKG